MFFVILINFFGELHLHLEFPSWFIGLYQMCLTLLDTFCQSPLPIPFYDSTQQTCQCSLCNEFLLFLNNSSLVEQTFLISSDQLDHFNFIVQQYHPLIISTQSITTDPIQHRILIRKISKEDEEISRENQLLRSILHQIPLQLPTDDSNRPTSAKRFKSNQ